MSNHLVLLYKFGFKFALKLRNVVRLCLKLEAHLTVVELLLSQLVDRLLQGVLQVGGLFKSRGVLLVCLRQKGCLFVYLRLKLGQLPFILGVKVFIQVDLLNHLVPLDLSHVEFGLVLS